MVHMEGVLHLSSKWIWSILTLDHFLRKILCHDVCLRDIDLRHGELILYGDSLWENDLPFSLMLMIRDAYRLLL